MIVNTVRWLSMISTEYLSIRMNLLPYDMTYGTAVSLSDDWMVGSRLAFGKDQRSDVLDDFKEVDNLR